MVMDHRNERLQQWTRMNYDTFGSSQVVSFENPHQYDSEGAQFWERIDGYPTYNLDPGVTYDPSDHSDSAQWNYIYQLQSNMGKLDPDLAIIHPRTSYNKGSLELESDGGLKRAASDLTDPTNDSETSPESLKGAPTKRRRYTRRPKPDVHAPVKPLTAYASFANDLRKQYASLSLSFAELAKKIGVAWQCCPAELRDLYLSNANTEKDMYEVQLEKYKTTEEYRQYQIYCEEFKAKHKK